MSHPRAARRLAVLSACAALVAAPAASALAAPAGKAPAQKLVVRGRVTDAVTHKPVVGACVKVIWSQGEGPASCVLTDARGKYQVTGSRAEGPVLGIGVEPAGSDLLHVGRQWSLADGDQGAKIVKNLELGQAGALSGRVLNRAGTPVAGICPQVRGVPLEPDVDPPVATCSGADGRWQLARVPAGSVAVALLGTGGLQGSYVPTATTVSAARRFDVVPAATTPLPDTVLSPAGTVVVRADIGDDRDNVVFIATRGTTQDPVSTSSYARGTYVDGELVVRIDGLQADDHAVAVQSGPAPGDCDDDYDRAQSGGGAGVSAGDAAPTALSWCDDWEWPAPFDGSGVRGPVTVRSGAVVKLTLVTGRWPKSVLSPR